MRVLMIGSLLLVSFLFFVSCAQKVDTDEKKTLYSMGTALGARLAQLDLTQDEVKVMSQGFVDSALNKELLTDPAEHQGKIQEFFTTRVTARIENEKKIGEEYMAKFLQEEGVKKTDSGLAYKILAEGTGNTPKATDLVKVHYHGTLVDGTVFDSSIDRGQEVSFPLDRVIRGWTEGLQLIKEKGKIKLVLPPDLAYGEVGAPPKIAGGATLVFEIELISIEKPEAAAAPAKPAAPAAK